MVIFHSYVSLPEGNWWCFTGIMVINGVFSNAIMMGKTNVFNTPSPIATFGMGRVDCPAPSKGHGSIDIHNGNG